MAPQIEPVDHVVEVTLGFRLFGEVLLPAPLVEQLAREQVPVRVTLGVEARARIAVPVPRATDTAARFEQLHREAGFARAIQLIDAGDAGPDDEHVDIVTAHDFRSWPLTRPGRSGPAHCSAGYPPRDDRSRRRSVPTVWSTVLT
jgi:hypothetical protein